MLEILAFVIGLTGLSGVFFWVLSKWRSYQNHKTKTYEHRITFSGSAIASRDGELWLDLNTWADVYAKHVFTDPVLLEAVSKCARDLGENEHIICMSGSELRASVHAAIVNYLSPRAMPWKVRSLFSGAICPQIVNVFYVLTWETYPDIRVRKLRVVLATAEVLERVRDPSVCSALRYSHGHHSDRLTTLKAMGSRHTQDGIGYAVGHILLHTKA